MRRPSASGRPVIGFIATKPIQIVTCMSIAHQLGGMPVDLHVVRSFADADGVIARLRSRAQVFRCVRAAPHRLLALAAQGGDAYRKVFIDSDVGARPTVMMWLLRRLRPQLSFALYEEGLSLFEPRDDERPWRVFEWLGATPTLGEGAFTDEVWTYSPEELRARLPGKTLSRIDEKPADFIRREHAMLTEVFWPSFATDTSDLQGQRCCFYLPSWQPDPRSLDYLARRTDHTLLKLHPHTRSREVQARARAAADRVLPAAVPAELVLSTLAQRFQQVDVLHDGTTTARYFDAPNVRFFAIDDDEQASRPHRLAGSS